MHGEAPGAAGAANQMVGIVALGARQRLPVRWFRPVRAFATAAAWPAVAVLFHGPAYFFSPARTAKSSRLPSGGIGQVA